MTAMLCQPRLASKKPQRSVWWTREHLWSPICHQQLPGRISSCWFFKIFLLCCTTKPVWSSRRAAHYTNPCQIRVFANLHQVAVAALDILRGVLMRLIVRCASGNGWRVCHCMFFVYPLCLSRASSDYWRVSWWTINTSGWRRFGLSFVGIRLLCPVRMFS